MLYEYWSEHSYIYFSKKNTVYGTNWIFPTDDLWKYNKVSINVLFRNIHFTLFILKMHWLIIQATNGIMSSKDSVSCQ